MPAAKELLLLSRLINQTVGDAISGILLVELILRWARAWGAGAGGVHGYRFVPTTRSGQLQPRTLSVPLVCNLQRGLFFY